ncbi:MAG: NAD(P)-binding domain-containing protein [Chloroflexota bacterium]
MKRLITWGTGELGGRVARLWHHNGGEVIGFTQTTERHATLQKSGITPRAGDPTEFIKSNDILLLSLPGHLKQKTAVEALRDQTPTHRIVLVSSTGYYGLPEGTVTEETPVGDGKRPAAIADTERLFQEWAGKQGVLIRLGGLYRKGRGPYSALYKKGVAPLGPPNKTLALIHYDDAAQAIFEALRHPQPQATYLAVTPPCPTRQMFYTAACEKLDASQPDFSDPLPHPPAIFDVAQLRQDLLPNPAYPDWEAALG